MPYIPTHFWVSFSILILIMLTYQDYKNKMMVDNRKNIFAMGFTMPYIIGSGKGFIFIIATIILAISLGYYINKFKLLGGADASTMQWLFMGYAAIGLPVLIGFFVVFIGIYIIWALIKFFVFKIKGPMPFYPVFLIAHITAIGSMFHLIF